ncbi:MAG: DUF3078 domain-containing protein [Bacteroidetes bacterium]|nr:DUF3078 domain-containing protein [Bacteroidota bacterium]
MKNFKKTLILLTITTTFISVVHGQNRIQALRDEAQNVKITKDPNDTTKQTWKTGGLFNVNFNQAALSNWSAGGDKSAISLAALLNLYAFYTDGRHNWDNSLNLAYGFAQTTSLGGRKTDDRIDLVSKYGYDIGKKWYLSGLFNFRSQFTKGYNYPDQDTKVLTSNFLSPGYFLLSIGMDYKPVENFSLFLSPITAREVVVLNDSLASVAAFGVDSGKHSRFQLGAYASVNYKANLSKTAVYTGKLDLFSDYLRRPQNITLYMTNILAVKVTRLISMSLSVTLIYDNDVKSVKSDGSVGGPALQLQEIMGIGFAYQFRNKTRAPTKPAQ